MELNQYSSETTMKACEFRNETIELWHRRLEHANGAVIRRMAEQEIVRGMDMYGKE